VILNVNLLNVSFVGSSSLPKPWAQTDAHVIVTQIVPYPLDDTTTLLKEGRFVPFQWSDLKALLKNEAPP
jgi:hypothetical protein